MSSGTLTTGGVVSWTVTVKVAVPVLSLSSLALHVTVVVPIGKLVPDARLQAVGTVPLTRSVAVAAANVAAAPFGPVASTVTGPGTVTTGGVVSCTRTLKLAVATCFVSGSVAAQTTLVVPSFSTLPSGGTQTTMGGPLSSVTVMV